MVETQKEDFKYQSISDSIEKMINEEVLRIGEKLPSIRTISGEYGISKMIVSDLYIFQISVMCGMKGILYLLLSVLMEKRF